MKKEKIVLVVPNFRWKPSMENILWHYIPYGLCMIAAVIEKKYDVVIIDAHRENLTEEEFSNKIKVEQPQILGITVLMDYFGQTMHTTARLVKAIDENIVTVVGGVYATTNIEKVLNDSNVDFLIAGEGEIAFRELVEKIFAGMEYAFQLKGLYYKKDNVVIGQGRASIIKDLDTLPLPAYHLIDYKQYTIDVSRNSLDRPSELPYAEVITSRGCPYQCCFCQVNHISGRNFRGRSANNVLAEIDWLVEQYKIKSIIFMDDNFLTDRTRAKLIMEGLEERNISWKMMATAVFLLDNELLKLMKRSGCSYIDIAIESGTYRVLHEVIHKPIKSFDKVIDVVKKARNLGIYVAANFIVGFPTETWNEIRATLKFAEQIDVDYVKIFNAVPLPHTEMYEEAKKLQCIAPEYDSENIDWKAGMIETDEFSVNDLTVLRAYEWDRINFSDAKKRKRTAEMMEISEEELNIIRKKTRDAVKGLLQ